MQNVYIICFWVGLLVTVLSSLGGLSGRSTHLHWGHVFGGHVHGGPSPVNLSTVMTFLTVFGGIGFMFTKLGDLGGVIVLLIALACGGVIAWLLFLLVSRILLRGEQVMDDSDYDLTGQVGQVSVPIPENSVGEVKYVLAGTTRAIGARSRDARPLPKNTRVVIRAVDRGVALVEDYETFVRANSDAASTVSTH